MRTHLWFTRVVLVALAIACGDQPTEVVPDQDPGTIALATSTSDDGLSITTDKDDYAPGDTVWFTGAGWQAGDTLDIVLVDEPLTHPPHEWWVNVDETGGFRDSTYVVDVGDLGVTFTLTATSRATGRSLTVVFTDGNIRIQSSPDGVTFTVTATKYIGSGNCTTGAQAPTTPTISSSPTTFTANPAGGGPNPSPVESYKFVAAASSDQTPAAAFVNWTTADPVVSNVGNTICVVGFNGNRTYTANYNAASDLKLAKSAGAFSVGNPGTYTLVVTNAGNATASGPSGNRITVTDNLPAGLTPPANFNEDNFTCTVSGQTVTCLLAAGQSIAVGATRTIHIGVGVTAAACSSVNNSATVSGGNEPAGNVGTDNTGSVSTNIAGCNSGPTADAGGPYEGTEGSPVSFDGTGSSDPDPGTTLTYDWDFGDGSAHGSGASPSHTYADDGLYTVKLIVSDGSLTSQASTTATITNVAPTATFNTPGGQVNEGSSFDLSLTGATDVSSVDVTAGLRYAFDCGGGYSASDYASASTTNNVTCNTAVDGPATLDVNAKVFDKDDEFTEYTGSVTVKNLNPTATFNTPSGQVDEGSAFTLSLTGATDASSADIAAGLRYAFNCGSGYSATDYASASTMNNISCHTAVDGPATLSVKGKVIDKDNGFTEYPGSVTVKNLPPSATFQAPNDVDEGSAFTLKLANGTDPSSVDQASLHYAFDCGSGYSATDYASAIATNDVSCNTAVDGPASLSVKGTVFDKDGASAEYTRSVTVKNVAPTITNVTANPSGQLTLGGNNQVSTTVTVTFTDPAGSLDAPFTTAIDCGNGTNANGLGVCTYTVADVGFRTISATVTDKDGGVSAPGTTQVQVIYNWTGFFQPVDNTNLNVVKAGSAIPVKFNLGGYQGLAIFAAAYPSSTKVTCDSHMDQDNIEETVNAGGSSLNYDASGSQYIYVWKSDKLWGNQCRRLDVKLNDQTTHSAYFKFRP